MRISWSIVAILLVIIVTYGSACAYVRIKRQASYDSVRIGDTADVVLAQFGDPSVKEAPDKFFGRYASTKCRSPCVQRLWFENRLALDIEAWSVSLGSDGRVVEKNHWISP